LFVIHAGVVENGGGTAGEVEAKIGVAILMLFVIVWMGGDAARRAGGGDGDGEAFRPTRGLDVDLLALADGGSLTTLFFPLKSSPLSASIDLRRFLGLDSSSAAAAAPFFASPLPTAPGPSSSFSSPSPLTLEASCSAIFIFIFDPSSFVSCCFSSRTSSWCTPSPAAPAADRAFARLRFFLLLLPSSSPPPFFLDAGGELLLAAPTCSILSISISRCGEAVQPQRALLAPSDVFPEKPPHVKKKREHVCHINTSHCVML
jgi:hypothetical protein